MARGSRTKDDTAAGPAEPEPKGVDGKAADGETSDESRGNAGHNVADKKALIRDCAREMVQIKAQRQDLNEQAAEIRQRLRDAGVQTRSFDFAVKVYQMEAEAKGDYLDWLSVCFEALGVGEQSTLFPEAEHVGDEQLRKAKKAGGDASFEGQKSTANPHDPKDPRRAEWHAGWLDHQAKLANEMAPKEEGGSTPAFIAGEGADQEAAGTA